MTRGYGADGGYISSLSERPVPQYLAGRILRRIETLKRRGALARAGALALLSALSFFCLLQTFSYLADEMYLTGFMAYADLLFTDTHTVLGSWHEFALSLADSLPALPCAVVCVLLCIFVWSLARSARNVSVVFAKIA